jgi:hypothetical protein
MTRPRAADDCAAIRARMKELHYERERAEAAEIELRGDPSKRPARIAYWSQREINAVPGPVRQPGPLRS